MLLASTSAARACIDHRIACITQVASKSGGRRGCLPCLNSIAMSLSCSRPHISATGPSRAPRCSILTSMVPALVPTDSEVEPLRSAVSGKDSCSVAKTGEPTARWGGRVAVRTILPDGAAWRHTNAVGEARDIHSHAAILDLQHRMLSPSLVLGGEDHGAGRVKLAISSTRQRVKCSGWCRDESRRVCQRCATAGLAHTKQDPVPHNKAGPGNKSFTFSFLTEHR